MVNKEYNLTAFNLESIRQAALNKSIRYKGRKINRDVANLGYTLDDVSSCIASLTMSDYQKTVKYDDSNDVFDVYIKNRTNHLQTTDRIYMKLRLLKDDVIEIVEVGSFHL